MNDTAKLQKIRALYATLPKIECKKKCFLACGPVPCTRVEWKELTRANGGEKCGEKGARLLYKSYQIGFHEESGQCMFLKDDLCSVYESRPAICRVFGLTPKMVCPFGCVPERWMTPEEEKAFWSAVEALGY